MTAEHAARALHAALAGGPPLDALPDGAVPEDIGTAYAIQDRLVALDGRGIIGWKLAVSTAAAQAANGLSEPTVAPLLSGMLAETGADFRAGTFRQPEIEPEFALTLVTDLDGDADADAVRAATGAVRLAMEIADTRYVTKGVHGQPGSIADLNCDGALVLGPGVPPEAVSDSEITAILADGTPVAGFAPDKRPDPFAVTAFLARFLAARGRHLRAGDVITTGTCAPPTRTPPGEVRCDFGRYGAVSATIAG